MAGDTDSLGRPFSAHTSTKAATGKTAAAAAAAGASQSGLVGQISVAGGGDDSEGEDDDVAAAAGVPAKAKANRPVSRRNHQELEELARYVIAINLHSRILLV